MFPRPAKKFPFRSRYCACEVSPRLFFWGKKVKKSKELGGRFTLFLDVFFSLLKHNARTYTIQKNDYKDSDKFLGKVVWFFSEDSISEINENRNSLKSVMRDRVTAPTVRRVRTATMIELVCTQMNRRRLMLAADCCCCEGLRTCRRLSTASRASSSGVPASAIGCER